MISSVSPPLPIDTAGRPIGANDLLIASQTVALGYTLVSDNEREFSRIEALQLEIGCGNRH